MNGTYIINNLEIIEHNSRIQQIIKNITTANKSHRLDITCGIRFPCIKDLTFGISVISYSCNIPIYSIAVKNHCTLICKFTDKK